MRRTAFALLMLPLLASLTGCRSSNGSDLIEAELRARNDDLRLARSHLDRTNAYNEYLQRELRNLRQSSVGKPPAPGASTATPVVKIELARQTGGYEKDGIPGDELLQVVLVPRDGDQHAVKAAGRVEVTALTISREGIKAPLCRWVVHSAQLRRTWRSGLLSTGYFLQLPWKNWPTSPKVRVIVRFLAADQRIFEEDKDVTVRVLPTVLRQTPPVGIEEPAPIPFPTPTETIAPPVHVPPDSGTSPPQMPTPIDEPPQVLPAPTPVEKAPPDIKNELPLPPKISTSKKLSPGIVQLLAPVLPTRR